jgi:hypothetical protein
LPTAPQAPPEIAFALGVPAPELLAERDTAQRRG